MVSIAFNQTITIKLVCHPGLKFVARFKVKKNYSLLLKKLLQQKKDRFIMLINDQSSYSFYIKQTFAFKN